MCCIAGGVGLQNDIVQQHLRSSWTVSNSDLNASERSQSTVPMLDWLLPYCASTVQFPVLSLKKSGCHVCENVSVVFSPAGGNALLRSQNGRTDFQLDVRVRQRYVIEQRKAVKYINLAWWRYTEGTLHRPKPRIVTGQAGVKEPQKILKVRQCKRDLSCCRSA